MKGDGSLINEQVLKNAPDYEFIISGIFDANDESKALFTDRDRIGRTVIPLYALEVDSILVMMYTKDKEGLLKHSRIVRTVRQKDNKIKVYTKNTLYILTLKCKLSDLILYS